ncbi:MAG TPA: thymidylate kinase [Candidatus Babeliales bacterium]|nr:thymidylate kinase [Candidatus Babeliales bacterium]
MERPGIFIVIEGSDGSGKATQFNLLAERLRATGYDVAVFDFPRYTQESSYFVRRYLAGEYGPASKVSPYTASLFYAMDRYEASKDIDLALRDGKIVLADRYVGSNMAHQGGKFSDSAEQRGFFVWNDNLEFQLLGIPRPDISFFLRVPAEISKKIIEKRAKDANAKLDEHEKDVDHLKKTLTTYDTLCQLFPKDFRAVECTKQGALMDITEINNLIWEELKPLLPKEKHRPSHSVVVTLENKQAKPETNDLVPDKLDFQFKDVSLLLQLAIKRTKHSNLTPEFGGWPLNKFRFYTPLGLPRNISEKYKSAFEQLAKTYQELELRTVNYLERQNSQPSDKLFAAARALMSVTPLGALTTFSVRIDKAQVKPLTGQLLANDLVELQWAAKQIYLAARQKWPEEFSIPLEANNSPESINNIIAKLAEDKLSRDYSSDKGVKLLDAQPRLEFDLLAESIYPYTNLSLEEIVEEVAAWPYLQKYESLRQAAAQPGLLRKVRYKMDIISDHLTLNEILKVDKLKDIQAQNLTPRYGYEVPVLIEDSGLDDLYDECFDKSLQLFSLLQLSEREDLAAYTTLLGHKFRWQLNTDAAQMVEVLKNIYKTNHKLSETLTEKLLEVHPLLWDVLTGASINTAVKRNGKSRVKPSRQRKSKSSRPKK